MARVFGCARKVDIVVCHPCHAPRCPLHSLPTYHPSLLLAILYHGALSFTATRHPLTLLTILCCYSRSFTTACHPSLPLLWFAVFAAYCHPSLHRVSSPLLAILHNFSLSLVAAYHPLLLRAIIRLNSPIFVASRLPSPLFTIVRCFLLSFASTNHSLSLLVFLRPYSLSITTACYSLLLLAIVHLYSQSLAATHNVRLGFRSGNWS